MQAETVNMMTKYQLVFVKMENQFAKVFNSNKLRALKIKQEAFYQVKKYAIGKNGEVNYKMHVIYQKLKNKVVNNLVDKYQNKVIRS